MRRLALLFTCLAFVRGAHAAVDCRAPAPQAMLERFISANCEACWQAPAGREPRPGTIVLDWIAPAQDDAPLAAAALAEATARAGSPPAQETLVRQTALARDGGVRVRIADGPAWYGYVALQLTVRKRGRPPAGAVGYAALVERVAAGSDGSPMARQLVRAVVGPLPLDELASQPMVQHLRAVRLPEGGRAERLASVGWVEAPQGKVIAAAQSPLVPCPSPPP